MSPWVEVTQERIDTFAKAIEDFQWIHVDPERAKGSPFGGTIAHGFLTLSLLSHLSEHDLLLLRPQDGRQLRPEPRALHLAGAGRLARARALHAREVRADRRQRRAGHLEHRRSRSKARDKPALVAEWIGRHYY